MIRYIFLLCILSILGFSASASARSLYWDSLEVTARLDADGRLHVLERQAYVFTGAWNGGERTFNIRPGQELDFHRLTRIDPADGERREVKFGSLSRLDRCNWDGGQNRLRWRSRLPSDPPFDATPITYELEYTLSNILIPRGDGTFLLDHDFAFPDRPGPILRYSLDLEMDPAWQPPAGLPSHLERDRLEPGQGVVLRALLRHLGPGRPAGVIYGAPQWLRLLLVLLPVGMIAGRGLFLYIREQRLGKFAPLFPASRVTRSWLEKEILSMPPEVVGATWDDTTSAAEVAAILARMVQEGKLASRVETRRPFLFKRSVLHLELKADRKSLPEYEGRLVRALFFSGNTTTDTDSIRSHYRRSGFDPAEKIRKPLEDRVKALTRPAPSAHDRAWLPTLLLFLTAAGTAAGGAILHNHEFRDTAIGFGIATVMFIFTSFAAYAYQTGITTPRIRFALFHLPLLAMAAGVAWFALLQSPNGGGLSLAGISLYVLCLCNSIFNLARTRQDAERIGLRKTLAAGRKFMRSELRKPSPHLEDDWYPYLLAFGLGPQMDRWFRAFGSGAREYGRGRVGESGSWSSSGGPSGSFSGGGGMFGGAGSSGSWAAAAGAIAAGVATPGSSGGSGGGGGGGGSSGGGGGGGW
jgi:uncharacterized membrane protein YgcG